MAKTLSFAPLTFFIIFIDQIVKFLEVRFWPGSVVMNSGVAFSVLNGGGGWGFPVSGFALGIFMMLSERFEIWQNQLPGGSLYANFSSNPLGA